MFVFDINVHVCSSYTMQAICFFWFIPHRVHLHHFDCSLYILGSTHLTHI
uniref:Uncharacterized protein n=1 Tax=Anguilla anguilla TaxID=7936 RepID=A0A0E9UBL5_ANGAN